MFWGLTLEAGKHYSQSVEDSFHVSMAALELDDNYGDVKALQRIKVMVQHQKKEFLLCSLICGATLIQQPLDLDFTEGEHVTFYLEGNGVVHLTGYLVREKSFEPEEEPILGSPRDSSEDGMEVSSSDSGDDDDLDDTIPTLQDLAKGEDIDSDDEGEDDWIPVTKKGESVLKRKLGAKALVPSKKKKQGHKKEPPSDETDDSDGQDSLPESADAVEEINDLFNDIAENAAKGKQPTSSPKNKTRGPDTSHENLGPTTSQKEFGNITTPQSAPVVGEGEASKRKKKKKKKKQQPEVKEADSPTKNETQPTQAQQKTPGKSKKKLSSGVIVEDTVVGQGKIIKPLKMVGVYYRGTLAKTKKEFDSCLSGNPFRFRFGAKEVIPGWDSGLAGMRVGGKRTLTIPASQGYGGKRAGSIPPNSTLFFEVELKEVR